MKLAENLRKYRKQKHFTQSNLAHKLHVSRKTISNWENGRNQPSYQTLDTLSNIYKIPATTLINGEITKPSKKVIISYYLNVILLILYYLLTIKHLIIIKYIRESFILINLIFLTLNYKDWRYTIKNKIALVAIIFATFIEMIFNVWIWIAFHNENLIKLAHESNPFQLGFISALIFGVAIIAYSFFITLFLSKNLKFLFKKW